MKSSNVTDQQASEHSDIEQDTVMNTVPTNSLLTKSHIEEIAKKKQPIQVNSGFLARFKTRASIAPKGRNEDSK